MHAWAQFLAIAAAFVAVALIVATTQYTHGETSSRLYASTLHSHHNGEAPGQMFGVTSGTPSADLPSHVAPDFSAGVGKDNSDYIVSLGREGARWSHNSHFEATVWAAVILILLFVLLGAHFWEAGSARRR